MVDNYETISRKLEKLEPFTGNSLRGHWVGSSYIVVSYETNIAVFNSGRAVINSRKYSVTTSKQQSKIRAAWRKFEPQEYESREKYGSDLEERVKI